MCSINTLGTSKQFSIDDTFWNYFSNLFIILKCACNFSSSLWIESYNGHLCTCMHIDELISRTRHKVADEYACTVSENNDLS